MEEVFPSNEVESELRAHQWDALEFRLNHALGEGPQMIKLKVKLALLCLAVLEAADPGPLVLADKYAANIFLAALLSGFFGPRDLRRSIQQAVEEHYARGGGGCDEQWGRELVKLAFLNEEESNRQDRYENYFVLSSLVRLLLNELLKLTAHGLARTALLPLLRVVASFLPCVRLRRLLPPLPELPPPLAALDIAYYRLLEKFFKLTGRLDFDQAELLWQGAFNTKENIQAALQFLVVACAKTPQRDRLAVACIFALVRHSNTNVASLLL